MLKDQWHLQNKGQHGSWTATAFKAGADAKVVEAWNWLKNTGTDSITVAVIDSGFDLSHPDLKGNGNKIVSPGILIPIRPMFLRVLAIGMARLVPVLQWVLPMEWGL